MRATVGPNQIKSIGLYNVLPVDIPHSELFDLHSVDIITFDSARNVRLADIRAMKVNCVLVNTPFQSSYSVDYDDVRIIYVDVYELTENDILHIIITRHLAPRIDDSDVSRVKTPSSSTCCNI